MFSFLWPSAVLLLLVWRYHFPVRFRFLVTGDNIGWVYYRCLVFGDQEMDLCSACHSSALQIKQKTEASGASVYTATRSTYDT